MREKIITQSGQAKHSPQKVLSPRTNSWAPLLCPNMVKAASVPYLAKLTGTCTCNNGPSVIWKFYSMLTDEVKKEHNSHMLNIGSCGLHILHRAFKDGAVASGWQLDRLFSNLHWLFQDSAARREGYTKVTGSSLFALQFCKHRWLENVLVAERTQSMWDSVVKYV